MHIPHGFLDANVSAVTALAAAGAVGASLHKVQNLERTRAAPLVGVTAAGVFAAQMVNFPVGVGVSGHLLGGVLAAVLLGPWAGALALTSVLIVQCLLFADGGPLALGANILNMAVIGSLVGYCVYAAARRLWPGPAGVAASAVLAAWVSVVLAAAACSIELAASGRYRFEPLFAALVTIHVIIGIGEALITGLAVSFVLRTRPELIYRPSERPPAALLAPVGGLAVAVLLAVFVAPFADTSPDGLEWVANRFGFGAADGLAPAAVSDYQFPGMPSPGLATSLAGLIGTIVVLGSRSVLADPFAVPHEPGRSVLRQPARVKLLVAFGLVLVISLPIQPCWPAHAVVAALLVTGHVVAGVPVKYIVKRLLRFLTFLGILALAIPLSFGGRHGWDLAGAVLIQGTLVFLVMLLLGATTPLVDLLVGLQQLHMPRTMIAILALMTRYTEVLAEEHNRTRRAMKARTFTRPVGWTTRANLVGMLLVRSIDRAERVHQAMLARGWDGRMRSLSETER